MEMWKESQIRQLTFAKGIDTAFPILLNFAKNIGFSFVAFQLLRLNAVRSSPCISTTTHGPGINNMKKKLRRNRPGNITLQSLNVADYLERRNILKHT